MNANIYIKYQWKIKKTSSKSWNFALSVKSKHGNDNEDNNPEKIQQSGKMQCLCRNTERKCTSGPSDKA